MVVAASCVGLAGLSLLLPWDLSFDPWGWTLWGRELTSAAIPFRTGLFPAWKPLPVMFTTVFSLFGNAVAPDLWLLVARTGALAAVVLAFRLGARLGGRVAGVAAAAGLVLLPESTRYFAGGASEPLLVALLLGAIDRHLSDRRGQALALGFAAALLRPEVWPFLGVYSVVYAWRRPRRLPIVAAMVVALALLWFVPEWIGAGDPFYGAWLARVSAEAKQTQSLASPELAALGRALGLVILPLSLAAIVTVVEAVRRREPVPLVLAGGAVAWIALVVVMTSWGYAGLGRFSVPAGAVICVLRGHRRQPARPAGAARGSPDRHRGRAAPVRAVPDAARGWDPRRRRGRDAPRPPGGPIPCGGGPPRWSQPCARVPNSDDRRHLRALRRVRGLRVPIAPGWPRFARPRLVFRLQGRVLLGYTGRSARLPRHGARPSRDARRPRRKLGGDRDAEGARARPPSPAIAMAKITRRAPPRRQSAAAAASIDRRSPGNT